MAKTFTVGNIQMNEMIAVINLSMVGEGIRNDAKNRQFHGMCVSLIDCKAEGRIPWHENASRSSFCPILALHTFWRIQTEMGTSSIEDPLVTFHLFYFAASQLYPYTLTSYAQYPR